MHTGLAVAQAWSFGTHASMSMEQLTPYKFFRVQNPYLHYLIADSKKVKDVSFAQLES